MYIYTCMCTSVYVCLFEHTVACVVALARLARKYSCVKKNDSCEVEGWNGRAKPVGASSARREEHLNLRMKCHFLSLAPGALPPRDFRVRMDMRHLGLCLIG